MSGRQGWMSNLPAGSDHPALGSCPLEASAGAPCTQTDRMTQEQQDSDSTLIIQGRDSDRYLAWLAALMHGVCCSSYAKYRRQMSHSPSDLYIHHTCITEF